MALARGRQLPLNLRPRDDATFGNYVAQPRVRPALSAVADPAEQLVFLHGPEGGGKSHLLQAACHACSGMALYLPLASISGLSPTTLLDGVEQLAMICIDDVQAVAGNPDWERALFNLYNTVLTTDSRMLVTADTPPARLPTELPDLRSRLAAMLVYAIPTPNDAENREILVLRARQRGLTMPPEVARYITHRAGRSLPQLMSVLDQLDAASLAHQRALSIPFVGQIMGWQGV